MKRRLLVVVVFGVVVSTAVLAFVATASAGQVTKIMYAQENSDVYSYTNSSDTTGTLSVSIGWTDIKTGVATTFPVGQVDGDIFSGPPTGYPPDPYGDQAVDSLYVGTNPEVGSYDLPAGYTAYIAVLPYVGDNNYTIDVKFNGADTILKFNGTDVSGHRTAQAYGADGEVNVPSDGDWISCAQYWPGVDSLFYACWTDQVYEATAPAGGSDILSSADGERGEYFPPQLAQRNTLGGGGGHPNSSEWYIVAPQIWPGAAVGSDGHNIIVGNPQPGTVSWTTAPLWYTYSYPDASVATQTPAYMFSPGSTTAASKRNFCGETSTGATITYTFYGKSTDTPRTDKFDWYYETSKYGGKAQVTIDGVVQPLVDQSSSGWVFQVKKSYANLGNGPSGDGKHTVVITNTGTNGQYDASTVATLYHDAFVATQIPGGPPVWDENNYGGSTSYRFSPAATGLAHGNSFSGETSTNAAIACFFTGTQIDWYFETYKYGGIANVLIDGFPPPLNATVDQSSPGWVWQKEVSYTVPANTTHLILIWNSGLQGTSNHSTVATLYHDAFHYGTTWVEN